MPMRKMSRLIVPIAIGLFLVACASTPELNTQGVDKSMTAQVAQKNINSATGKRVLWGGMIMSAKNLPNKTEIEVLAFPLDDWNQPNQSATATGRFLAEHDGYLELADYARGRWLTLTGTVQGAQAGKVGEATYQFPVVRTDGMHLWPKESSGGSSGTQFQFGIGIGVIK